ncbi:MAG: hypothetical protein ACK4VV_12475 [Pseudomonas sp.]
MTQRDPSEPSRLLKDLESIRTLLDEPQTDEPQPAASQAAQLDIPLLQDIIIDAPGLDLRAPLTPVIPVAPVTPPVAASEPAPTAPPGPKPNPFLPYDQLARLAEERVQLDRLMAGHIPPAPATGTHTSTLVSQPASKHFGSSQQKAPTGAREVRMEARLHAEAQLLLQDVIDDLIPTIEAELRNRLQDKLEQLVREQMK